MSKILNLKRCASMMAVSIVFSGTAIAQVSFSGSWAPIYHEEHAVRVAGDETGDYAGIPINDAARLQADSFDPARTSAVTQYQCRPHGGDFRMRALANMRVDEIRDPLTQRLIAIKLRINSYETDRTIWLDGREHPDDLELHTWAGFSTGTWDQNMLNVRTTHLKKSYLRRNGLPRSELATFTDHWVRHGDFLTITMTIEDPAFLTEPMVRSQTWRLEPGQRLGRYICEYVDELPGEINDVPHYLPGENPFLTQVADWYGLPLDGVRGGSETIYPEYRDRLVLPEDQPQMCTRYCACLENNASCVLGSLGQRDD